jgi:uncharacterized membrane protein
VRTLYEGRLCLAWRRSSALAVVATRAIAADAQVRLNRRIQDQVVARRKTALLGTPTLSGALFALVFWFQSLTPTMVPRSWAVQAVISAICLAIGYGIGTTVGREVQHLLERWGRSPGGASRRRCWILLGLGWLISAFAGAALWLDWQNDQNMLMGIVPAGWFEAVLALAASVVGGVLLVVVGRAVAKGVGAINRVNCRHMPAVLAPVATVVLVVVLAGIVFRSLLVLAERQYGSVNDTTDPGVVMPDSPTVSGTGESLVAWGTLGRHGRTFVASAATAQELARFHGASAALARPVRVYVGLQSASTAAERAALAVRELERAGGFDRKVLVVWIPTGSGWVVGEAAEAIEQLYGGDTAIVVTQYSYLASQLSAILEPEQATDAGTTLFNAVHARWSQLPQGQRPKLVLFAKSLGTTGLEAPFVGVDASASVASLVARTDGALIVGAPYNNSILSQLTREREPGSPVWLPVFDNGRSVRFVNRDPRQPELDPRWPAPRIIYLQHPSDPATFWGLSALWWPPAWMDQPRGYDVPDAARWFPIVSGVQAIADLIEQLSPPPGFGHVYWTDYARAWARVVPPDGWTDADTQRLEQFLHNPGEGELED